jgi:hypothetical protein
MADVITLVKYQDEELSIRVFKTLDEARQVISKEYSKVLDLYYYEDLELIGEKYKDSEISEDYAFVYVEDNTHTIWEIFTIQV